jgi:hypothetical protein
MAEIKNYTLNFVSGRRASRGLPCAVRKLAYNEVQGVTQLRLEAVAVPAYG